MIKNKQNDESLWEYTDSSDQGCLRLFLGVGVAFGVVATPTSTPTPNSYFGSNFWSFFRSYAYFGSILI